MKKHKYVTFEDEKIRTTSSTDFFNNKIYEDKFRDTDLESLMWRTEPKLGFMTDGIQSVFEGFENEEA
jgi:hypothetical protein